MMYNNYYNNHIPNNTFYRPTPIYPNLEVQSTLNNENNLDNNVNDNRKFVEDDVKTINKQNIFDSMFSEDPKTNSGKEKTTREFFSINKDRLSILGFSLNIDDIIIIAIIIFLFLENKKDYLLLIVLGLMLLDISIDSLKNLNIIKQLFNPT